MRRIGSGLLSATAAAVLALGLGACSQQSTETGGATPPAVTAPAPEAPAAEPAQVEPTQPEMPAAAPEGEGEAGAAH